MYMSVHRWSSTIPPARCLARAIGAPSVRLPRHHVCALQRHGRGLSAARPSRGAGGHMVHTLLKLWRDDEAPTAVEYGLMVALIAIVIITAVALLGTNVQATFNTMAAALP